MGVGNLLGQKIQRKTQPSTKSETEITATGKLRVDSCDIQTDRQTDGRAIAYSEREREFTFTKKAWSWSWQISEVLVLVLKQKSWSWSWS